MGLEIYKSGQGKYARSIAYVLGVALIIFGGIRLFATINVPYVEKDASAIERALYIPNLPVIEEITLYRLIAFVVALLGMLGLHLLLNRPGSVDVLIDTEQELKKVSWPSRSEVRSATLVVVLVTFAMALMLFGFDELLRWAFRLVF